MDEATTPFFVRLRSKCFFDRWRVGVGSGKELAQMPRVIDDDDYLIAEHITAQNAVAYDAISSDYCIDESPNAAIDEGAGQETVLKLVVLVYVVATFAAGSALKNCRLWNTPITSYILVSFCANITIINHHHHNICSRKTHRSLTGHHMYYFFVLFDGMAWHSSIA